MRVRIRLKQGYGTATGDFFAFNTVADMPERLAVKLIAHRIASREPEPAAAAEAVEKAETPVKPKPRTRKA